MNKRKTQRRPGLRGLSPNALARAKALGRGMLKALDAGQPNVILRYAVESVGAGELFPMGDPSHGSGYLHGAAQALTVRDLIYPIEGGSQRVHRYAVKDREALQYFIDHEQPRQHQVKAPELNRIAPAEQLPLNGADPRLAALDVLERIHNELAIANMQRLRQEELLTALLEVWRPATP